MLVDPLSVQRWPMLVHTSSTSHSQFQPVRLAHSGANLWHPPPYSLGSVAIWCLKCRHQVAIVLTQLAFHLGQDVICSSVHHRCQRSSASHPNPVPPHDVVVFIATGHRLCNVSSSHGLLRPPPVHEDPIGYLHPCSTPQ